MSCALKSAAPQFQSDLCFLSGKWPRHFLEFSRVLFTPFIARPLSLRVKLSNRSHCSHCSRCRDCSRCSRCRDCSHCRALAFTKGLLCLSGNDREFKILPLKIVPPKILPFENHAHENPGDEYIGDANGIRDSNFEQYHSHLEKPEFDGGARAIFSLCIACHRDSPLHIALRRIAISSVSPGQQ